MGMFTAPAVIEAPAAKAAKSTKAEVAISGVEHLAMIDALQKSLETVRGTVEAEVKTAAFDRFMDHIQRTGQRPKSFNGVEGTASAMLTLGRKASTYALSEAHVALLREHGLEPTEVEITPQLFAINPTYAGDSVLLGKVEKALSKIVPADFIVMQARQSKLVATEDTLNAAVGRKLPAEVIQTLTTLTCRPKLTATNLSAILDFVRDLITEPAPAPAAAAKPAKLRKVA